MIETVFAYCYQNDQNESEMFVVVDETKDDIHCLILYLPPHATSSVGRVVSLTKKFFHMSRGNSANELHVLFEAP